MFQIFFPKVPSYIHHPSIIKKSTNLQYYKKYQDYSLLSMLKIFKTKTKQFIKHDITINSESYFWNIFVFSRGAGYSPMSVETGSKALQSWPDKLAIFYLIQ